MDRLPNFLSIFIFSTVLIFFVLFFRLFQLTIVKGDYYRRLSEENRIRSITIEALRGKILDRKGFELAYNSEPNLNQGSDRITSKRTYFEPQALSHLLGYRQIADRSDIKNDPCIHKLELGDKTGKKGVEKVFECDLRGISGKKLVELDARGIYVKTLYVIQPQAGKTIQLGLDSELQKKAYELLNSPEKNKKGAIVGINPKTGEILLFASTPSFNPQDFEDNNQTEIKEYLLSDDHPLFNRITEGAYPPGSIYKPFIATGALEEKKIDEKTQVEDTGILKAGSLTFGNWYYLQYGKTDGLVNIVKGIRRSNDIFFYRVGEKLGPQRIKFWGDKFGFGKKTNLPFEQSTGLIPSPFWKEETLKDSWYLGDTYNLSIGQGYVLVTPLQVAMATAAFANGGNLCDPQLLKTDKGNCKNLGISKKTLDLVRQGMKEACSLGGTGWPLFEFKPQTACKTGTAEASDKSKTPHAWITVFAPYENPRIVLTVLIENGGQGSDVAGPIAKEILKTFFERSQ